MSFEVASGKSPPNLSPLNLSPPQPTSLFITPSHLLDTFIKDFLEPNEKFLKQIKKDVNTICEFLKNNCFKDSSTKVLKAVKVSTGQLLGAREARVRAGRISPSLSTLGRIHCQRHGSEEWIGC